MTVHCIGSDFWPHARPWQNAVPPWLGIAGGAIWRLGPEACVDRTQSVDATVMLMIDGRLDLSSYRGRERLERGMLAIRPSFDWRLLRAGPGGATWLQLPGHVDRSLGATYPVADVDRLLLLAGRGLSETLAEVEKVRARMPSLSPLRLHWVDDLKTAILADPYLSISEWARSHHVSREGAARAFRAAYSVSPARFRLELRARRAWSRIVDGAEPLSLIALETGFADQSHMTRAVGWLTGRPPSAWRRKRQGQPIDASWPC